MSEDLTVAAPILLLDPVGGLAGDMLVGALLELDAALLGKLRETLPSLGLPSFTLHSEAAMRRKLGCTKAEFEVRDESDHRHLPEIRERIAGSTLSARARAKADETFVRLAEAEAAVHRIALDRVHFHEVGAADAILDICAVCCALDELGIEELLCGPLPGGSGTIRCEHGDMPCPAPAVVELLAGFELLAGVGEGEMVTPTGAALLCAWGRPLVPGELRYRSLATGYGAGTRAGSLLRVQLVEATQALGAAGLGAGWARDQVLVLDTHLDDESPELLAYLSERLFELGALDVAYTPLTMKKGRPGVGLRAMLRPSLRRAAIELIASETSALGIREQLVDRTILTREQDEVQTPWGSVRVKRAGGRARPEYEDLARIARERGLPLRVVAAAAHEAAAEAAGSGGEP